MLASTVMNMYDKQMEKEQPLKDAVVSVGRAILKFVDYFPEEAPDYMSEHYEAEPQDE